MIGKLRLMVHALDFLLFLAVLCLLCPASQVENISLFPSTSTHHLLLFMLSAGIILLPLLVAESGSHKMLIAFFHIYRMILTMRGLSGIVWPAVILSLLLSYVVPRGPVVGLLGQTNIDLANFGRGTASCWPRKRVLQTKGLPMSCSLLSV